MHSWKRWLDPGRRLLSLFLALAVLVSATLLWLGLQLVRQDREISAQRLQERRETAADLAVAALQQSIARSHEQLATLTQLPKEELPRRASGLAAALPAGSLLIVLDRDEFRTYPPRRLPYLPLPPRMASAPTVLESADKLELQDKNHAAALAVLSQHGQSPDPMVRGAALLRVARIHKKEKNWQEALRMFERLKSLDGVSIEGIPAALIGKQQRLAIYSALADHQQARSEAKALLGDLESCRFTLSRGAYEFYWNEAQSVSEQAVGRPAAIKLAGAVESLYGVLSANTAEGPGRIPLPNSAYPAFALWHTAGTKTAALLLDTQWFVDQWSPELRSTLSGYGVSIRFSDSQGKTIIGPRSDGSKREALRLAAATQLPWDVRAVTTDPEASLGPAARRRNLVVASMAAITVLVLAGSFLIGRTITRELAFSRFQSEFVSSVSHEFRTPLTSLCLLSEHLASGRIHGEAERQEYFEVLARESVRLRRLVEGLLNFGRMEAGAAQYRFETIDPAELVQSVSQEYAKEAQAQGYNIKVTVQDNTPLVRADRAALACALWNLIDNAVKYSPDCSTVWTEVDGAGAFAAIRIRDRGIGIPPQERPQIFAKFVRGAAARNSAIRGTGVGLAMVQHIISAHRGEIDVSPNGDQGSVFTVRLPALS